MNDIENRSIEEIEGDIWPHNSFDSYVVKESQRCRKKPVSELNIEELRLLISQDIGLKIIVPIALRILIHNPYSEGDHYPGDLLNAIVNVPESFWKENIDLFNELKDFKIELQLFNILLIEEILPSIIKLENDIEKTWL